MSYASYVTELGLQTRSFAPFMILGNGRAVIKNVGFGANKSVNAPALTLYNCVNAEKLPTPSQPQFPHF